MYPVENKIETTANAFHGTTGALERLGASQPEASSRPHASTATTPTKKRTCGEFYSVRPRFVLLTTGLVHAAMKTSGGLELDTASVKPASSTANDRTLREHRTHAVGQAKWSQHASDSYKFAPC